MVEVTLIDDKLKEPTETFALTVTATENVIFKLPSTTQATITDND